MQLHQVQTATPRKYAKRVGRGGVRGKTSGRGTKGQKARAGHKMRPEIRDTLKKIPKRRGYGKNRGRTVNDSVVKPTAVNLASLETAFSADDSVTPETLAEKGVISRRGGSLPKVKVLGNGELSKKISVSGCAVSASARRAIEKAGGSIA